MTETLIVGAGLAGALAGLALSRQQRVTIVEAGQPGDGASGVAAGLAHTFMARKAKPIAFREEAWPALRGVLAASNAWSAVLDDPVVRPAHDAKQAKAFQQTAAAYPAETTWWSVSIVSERLPWIHAPHGALCVRQGCAIEVLPFVQQIVEAARSQGAEVYTGARLIGWEEHADGVEVHVRRQGTTQSMSAERVILALGYGWHDVLERIPLKLHFIKGHTVRVDRPPSVPTGYHVSGAGYAVIAPDHITLGSTYEHAFEDLTTDPARVQEVLAKAAQMIPALAEAVVLDAQTGVRVTVPGTRKPAVGPVSPGGKIWALTGLGSKGLLMGAWIASHLQDWLCDPSSIPQALHPSINTKG